MRFLNDVCDGEGRTRQCLGVLLQFLWLRQFHLAWAPETRSLNAREPAMLWHACQLQVVHLHKYPGGKTAPFPTNTPRFDVPTPEEQAEACVTVGNKVPGGPHFIRLKVADEEPAELGPYANPAVAKEECEAIRRAVVALLREAQPTEP